MSKGMEETLLRRQKNLFHTGGKSCHLCKQLRAPREGAGQQPVHTSRAGAVLVAECSWENSAAPTGCFHAVFPYCLFLDLSASSRGIRARVVLALTISLCKQGADLQQGCVVTNRLLDSAATYTELRASQPLDPSCLGRIMHSDRRTALCGLCLWLFW